MAVTLFLMMVVPALAQDLPDPGRRLTQEEIEGRGVPKAEEKLRTGPRDPHACERARQYYTMTCGAQLSRKEFSHGCSEAYALYRQACS